MEQQYRGAQEKDQRGLYCEATGRGSCIGIYVPRYDKKKSVIPATTAGDALSRHRIGE